MLGSIHLGKLPASGGPGVNNVTATSPLWTSPPIHTAVVGRFLGPRSARLAQLKSYFPALHIIFVSISGDSTGMFMLRAWPASFGSHAHQRAVIEVDRLKAFILDAINCPSFVYRAQLTHSLNEPTQQLVRWCQVPDSVARLAAELDVAPPLYYLRQAELGDLVQMKEEADLSVLFDRLVVSDRAVAKKVRHDQKYLPHINSLDGDLDRIAFQVGNKYLDVCKSYLDKRSRTFRLAATFGAQLFGKDGIRGRLSEVLPSVPPSISPSVKSPAFPLGTVLAEVARQHLKPTFNDAYPLQYHDDVVAAIEAAGFPPLPFELVTSGPTSKSEKVSIVFQLAPSFIHSHTSRGGMPEIQGYVAEYQFKLTFLYDRDRGRFVISPKGLVPRSARLVRHTWVHTVPHACPTIIPMPLMPRLKLGLARAHDRPKVWTLASTLLGPLLDYVNANLHVLRQPDPVGLDGEWRELTRLPTNLQISLSHFFLCHKRIVSFASPKHDPIAAKVSVRKTTLFYRYNDPVGGRSRAEMRNALCEVPRAQPTFLAVRMADTRFSEDENVLDDEDQGLDRIHERVVGFEKVVHGVAKALRRVLESAEEEGEE